MLCNIACREAAVSRCGGHFAVADKLRTEKRGLAEMIEACAVIAERRHCYYIFIMGAKGREIKLVYAIVAMRTSRGTECDEGSVYLDDVCA